MGFGVRVSGGAQGGRIQFGIAHENEFKNRRLSCDSAATLRRSDSTSEMDGWQPFEGSAGARYHLEGAEANTYSTR
jgi:hypothetical protein